MEEPKKKKTEQKSAGTNGGNGNGAKKQGRGKDFFKDMASKPNSRVILADTEDTYMFHDLLIVANLAVARGRSQAGRGLDMDVFKQRMLNIDMAALNFEAAIVDLLNDTKTKYKRKRSLNVLGNQFDSFRPIPDSPKPQKPAKQ